MLDAKFKGVGDIPIVPCMYEMAIAMAYHEKKNLGKKMKEGCTK